MPRDGPPHLVKKKPGMALGFERGLEFERMELTLRPGDAVVLYTDGVTEAFNREEDLYDTPRLVADAALFAGQSAEAISAGLLAKVRAFANGAPQSDDIALLTLKVNEAAGEKAQA
jgi:sigma-B regulation protein RsbU (phosphoserine phosphatase)